MTNPQTTQWTDLERVMLALPLHLRETLSILLLEKFTEGYEQATKSAMKTFEESLRVARTN